MAYTRSCILSVFSLDLAKNTGILPVSFFPMHLSEDTSLAVPHPSFQQLLGAVEKARAELGIMCDVYQRRIHDALSKKSRSPDSPASKKLLNVICSGFFMRMLDLNVYLQDQSAEQGNEEVLPAEQASGHIRLFVPDDDDAPDPDPDLLPFAAVAGETYTVWGA